MEVSTQNPSGTSSHAHIVSIMSSSPTPTYLEPFKEDYRVRLPNFEGPLDLLLHLIRKEQIDIYDIPVARICKRYLEHLEFMQQFDVNIAGEFMVMAATLTLLKSETLIPTEQSEEEEDPRLPLVAQLLEYERFKKAAMQLDGRAWTQRDVFTRPPTSLQHLFPKQAIKDSPIEPIDVYRLLVSLKTATDRTTRKPIEISVDVTSLKEKVFIIGDSLEKSPTVEFRDLLPKAYRMSDLIATFLAILELSRLKYLEVIQKFTFGPMQIRSKKPINELDTSLVEQF